MQLYLTHDFATSLPILGFQKSSDYHAVKASVSPARGVSDREQEDTQWVEPADVLATIVANLPPPVGYYDIPIAQDYQENFDIHDSLLPKDGYNIIRAHPQQL
jgi:hypothetical protein